MNRYHKIAIAGGVAFFIFLWLGSRSMPQTATYFFNVGELKNLDGQSRAKHLLVQGYIKEGSISPLGRAKTFILMEHKQNAGEQLKVICFDTQVPDKFLGGAEALVDGHLGAGGIFFADQLHAKSERW
jgi:cytochrome c-type biogenesis protein CcmE